jgi:hypothetical protein
LEEKMMLMEMLFGHKMQSKHCACDLLIGMAAGFAVGAAAVVALQENHCTMKHAVHKMEKIADQAVHNILSGR